MFRDWDELRSRWATEEKFVEASCSWQWPINEKKKKNLLILLLSTIAKVCVPRRNKYVQIIVFLVYNEFVEQMKRVLHSLLLKQRPTEKKSKHNLSLFTEHLKACPSLSTFKTMTYRKEEYIKPFFTSYSKRWPTKEKDTHTFYFRGNTVACECEKQSEVFLESR